MSKQTLQDWFNEHTACGFSEVASAQGWETAEVESEYFDGSYQIGLAGGIVWVANGKESIACEVSEINERFQESEVMEIRTKLGLSTE